MRNNKNNMSLNVRNITLNHKILTFSLQNLTSFYRNIMLRLEILTSHFYRERKILSSRFRNITLASIIIMLSFTNITLCSSNIFNNPNVSALDYSSNVGIGFTFNPTLSVSLSSSDLIISNLVPGSTLDSNGINVSVATNAAYGYTLSANVNDENLVHSNNIDTFSSIDTNADLESLSVDNTWGYTSKLNNETIWNNYNGLSSSSNTILLDNSNAADSTGGIDFKIAAKASSTQASGEYTGTINFIAITKPIPMNLAESYFAHGKTRYNGYYTMQDMTTEICNDTEVIGEGSQTQLIDIRDNKVYWVTKLADNHCWMTQNLDLDLDSNRTYTSKDTDLIDGTSTGAYVDGYSLEDNIIIWKPKNSTLSTIENWSGNDINPISLDVGEIYLSESNAHSLTGNYYNATAAIASNNSSGARNNTFNNPSISPKNSICSSGWRLPIITNYSLSEFGLNEFANLNYLYNDGKSNTNSGWVSSPLWFTRSGSVRNNSEISFIGNSGYYWSNTVTNGSGFYNATIFAQSVGFNNYDMRKFGVSVRCLAR